MVTIREIAQRAGVSPSTVSRVLRGKGRVSQETRERVFQVAEELGYTPNVSARALVTGRTGTIGFLIHPRQSLAYGSFYGEILSGIEKELQAHSFHILFSSQISEIPPAMVQEQRVDGLIIAGCDVPEQMILSLKERGIPLVLVDYHVRGVDSVVTDNEGGAYDAVTHLIKLGHRKIAFVCEWFGDLSFAERFEGYKKALADNGIPFDEDLAAEGTPRTSESGYVAMKKVLERATPSAVFAANDATAIGAMKAIKEAGFRIPQDIAIVGFDASPLSPHTTPPLTTVEVFRYKMGVVAARRLIDLMEEPLQPWMLIQISTRLIVRQSCGAGSQKG